MTRFNGAKINLLVPLEILKEAKWKPKIATEEHFWFRVKYGIEVFHS